MCCLAVVVTVLLLRHNSPHPQPNGGGEVHVGSRLQSTVSRPHGRGAELSGTVEEKLLTSWESGHKERRQSVGGRKISPGQPPSDRPLHTSSHLLRASQLCCSYDPATFQSPARGHRRLWAHSPSKPHTHFVQGRTHMSLVT